MTPRSAAAILAELERFGIRLGLEGPRELLAALGDPQQGLPAVLVAGTNGKGSTAALLAAMATAAGYRTGLYTSPHLEDVEERLRVDGVAVSPERLGDLLARVVAVAGERTPTYFEALTVAAFLDFAERRVDLAVLEVGMGGRLDATNLAEPLVSAIAPIGLDHTEHLGPTLAAIAREKAGVLRAGRPAVAWVEATEAAEALAEAARGVGADLRFADREVRIDSAALRRRQRPAGQRVVLATRARRYELDLALAGAHQARNLALAVAAAEALAGQGFPRLDAAAIARGAAACRWPGRLERVELPDGRRVLLDAAHNPHGAAALADFLAGEGEPYDLLFGALADKETAGMLPPIARRARRVVLTAPPSPRAQDPAALAALVTARAGAGALEVPERKDVPGVIVEPDPARALDRALEIDGRELVVCGSIFLIGEIRRRLRERFGVPQPARETPTYAAPR